MRIKNVALAFVLGAFIVSCENDDNDVILPLGDYENGILVSNEGPFSNGTGTISFISEDLTMVENEIYKTVNDLDLGNIVQSIAFVENKAYIVANVSNTITVVDRYTFEKSAIISAGLNNPRYFQAVNGRGYVSNWGDPNDSEDDYIAIVDLQTNTVLSTIPVAFGPEKINVTSNAIYVAHKGAYGQNNVISVIDATTDEVTASITVGYVPNSMQIDGEGNLWVLSAGKPSYADEETAGTLAKINTSTNEVVFSMDFGTTEHPGFLGIDGSKLYYSLNGSVFSMLATATTLPTESEFDNLYFYEMVVSEGKLYGTDAKDYASNGSMSIYALNTKEELATFDLGIIPGGIYFN